MKKILKRVLLTIVLLPIVLVCLMLFTSFDPGSECISIPVAGATMKDYNPDSFWHPWGDHNHRGVDIFAKRGTPVHPVRNGHVLWAGTTKNGGKNVLILDGYLYFTYYAHLDSITCHPFQLVHPYDTIGTVGNTGNAQGKPCHLHFSESSFFNDKKHGTQYDKKYKMYFTNPDTEFKI